MANGIAIISEVVIMILLIFLVIIFVFAIVDKKAIYPCPESFCPNLQDDIIHDAAQAAALNMGA